MPQKDAASICLNAGNMEVSDEDLRVVDVIKSASPDIQPLEDLAAKSEILKISPSIVGLESFIGNFLVRFS